MLPYVTNGARTGTRKEVETEPRTGGTAQLKEESWIKEQVPQSPDGRREAGIHVWEAIPGTEAKR